jgi:SAM-dependent methyltransferase
MDFIDMRGVKGLHLGIDASNIRQGGGVTHLSQLLHAGDPVVAGFDRVTVWTCKSTAATLPDRPWLVKRSAPWMEAALPLRMAEQQFRLPKELDAVADYTYSSHFLEHLFRGDAEHLLADMHRVLKVGGKARISVPDLEFAVGLYAAGDKERMLTQYFFIDDEDNHYSRHKYMYDFQMMEELLLRVGFREVRRWSFTQGDVPDISILDNRPDDSLFVEATK